MSTDTDSSGVCRSRQQCGRGRRGSYKRYLCDVTVKTPKKVRSLRRRNEEKNTSNEDLVHQNSEEESISQSLDSSLSGVEPFLHSNSSTNDSSVTDSSNRLGTSVDENFQSWMSGDETEQNTQEWRKPDATDHSIFQIEETGNDDRVDEENIGTASGQNDDRFGSAEIGETTFTTEQLCLLLQAFVLRHRLTRDALQDLLRIINLIAPETLPASPYFFKKCFADTAVTCQKHFYCCHCKSYLGSEGDDSINSCSNCNEPFDKEIAIKNNNFFIVLPLREQLIDLLTNQNLSLELSDSTLSNGSIYQDLCKQNVIGENDLTLLWNCDGVPAFKSSGFSVWPIQCLVTELPPECQKKNILMPGLWFGQSKPQMDSFLQPFVEECVKLGTDGFNWQNKATGEMITTRAHILACSSDSVARPIIRNCKQYNGQYGCDWCLHPGESIVKGNGHAKVYSLKDLPHPQLRSNEQFKHCSKLAIERDQPVLGVKGPSICMLIPNFDIVAGFVPDYLHCVLLGVVRQLTSLWLDSENNKKPWYLAPVKQRIINSRLTQQSPPNEITRTPRSLDVRKYWKGSEWRAFLLFYSLIVLKGVLPAVYLNHWFLLVFCINTLLQKHVPRQSIDLAERAIRKFVSQAELLYGKEIMSFNIHILLHLPSSVRYLAPLWATSAFVFENNNGILMKLFQGTQSVPLQITNTFCLWKDLTGRSSIIPQGSTLRPLFNKLAHGIVLLERHFNRCSEVVTLGAVCRQELQLTHRLALERLVGHRLQNMCAKYCKRFTISGVLYTTSKYTRAAKRVNYYFQGQDNYFYIIQHLVIVKPDCSCQNHCQCSEKPFIIVKRCATGRPIYVDSEIGIQCLHVQPLDDNIIYRSTAVMPAFLSRKCVHLTMGDTHYLSPLPNPYERD